MHEGGTASAVPPSLVLRPSGVEPLAGGGGEAVQLADADADPDRVALAGDVARVDADDDLALTGTGADVPLGRAGQVQLAVGQGVGAELLDEDHLDRDGALVSLADDVQRLGPEADGDVATVLGGDLGEHATVQRDAGVGQLRAIVDHLERADVHRRGADEAADEDVDRPVVHVARVADLLQQVGDPRDLYDRPVNVFVGGFIGSPAMNIGSFQVVDDGAQLANTRIPLDRGVLSKITAEDRGHITIGFRPESLDVVSQAHEGAIPIKVVLIEELGADALAYGELDLTGAAKRDISSGAGEGEIIVRVDPRNVPRKGDTVWVGIRIGELHCFSASTGERLNP